MVNKIIHQMFGVIPNELVSNCVRSWHILSKYCFEIRIWSDKDIIEFLSENYQFALTPFVYARNHAEASDIARYLIVYHFGGYYIDWDIRLNSPDNFILMHDQCPNGCLVIDPLNNTLASEFFSAKEQEPFLLELIKDIVAIYNSGKRELMSTPYFSGPFRMKASLAEHPISSQDLILTKDVFEYDYSEIRSAVEFGKRGVMTHFWIHSWLK